MKFFACLALLCLSFCASAQIQLGLKAGGQISAASYKRNGDKINTQQQGGFNAGMLAKIYFDDKVAFVPGLIYNTRGFKVSTLPGDTLKSYRLHYIDIPLFIQVDLSHNRGKGLYLKFGPAIGVGLSGKEVYTGKYGEEVRNKAILSLTGKSFGIFDASLNALAGYTIQQKFFIEAGFAYGIGNINNDPDGPKIKSRVGSLSVGYFFR